MRRRTTLSLALVTSLVLVSLTSSDSTAQAQQPGRTFVWDTGVVTLGHNQVLRLTATGDGQVLGNLLLRFRRTGYVEEGSIYKVASQTTTDPLRLSPSEAVSMDFNRDNVDAVRGAVSSNRRNVRVTAAVINTSTGETTSHIIMANTEGDF